jgi:Replication-relaxation
MSDALLRVQSHLTDRDHVLLGWLADHGVLTSFQIAHALYPSIDFAQKRLRKLIAIGVIARFRPQKPDGGSYPYHYVLDQLGVDVVAAQRGDELPRRDQAKRRRWYLTNRANLPHLLGVNQFFVDLAGYARTRSDTALERWWPASRCQQPGAFRDPGQQDPHVWLYKPAVRPDGHGIWHERDWRVPYFLEYDTGAEPLGTLVDKITGYENLAHVYDRVWPVLFDLHSPIRERHLHHQLSTAGIRYPVATSARDDNLRTGRCVAEDVWWLHRHDGGLLRLGDLGETVIDGRDQAA